jgi:GTPase SAR1 family protein
MGKYAQLVMGPAGSGKSTYCSLIQQHCDAIKRPAHVVNLDPAAEVFDYPCAIDIRELISLDDVMEELGYGPNGGLVYCMEYLVENMDWLEDKIQDFSDDYLIFDCPGQVELYSHLPVMKTITQQLQKWDYRVCAVYLLDSLVISDASRFVAGALMCLSAMVQLELPHVNILSKCDLVQNKALLDKFFEPDSSSLLYDLNKETAPRYRALNQALCHVLDDFSMVSFVPLDAKDEDSVEYVLSHIDHAIQFGEDEEPKEPRDEMDGEDDDPSAAGLEEREAVWDTGS